MKHLMIVLFMLLGVVACTKENVEPSSMRSEDIDEISTNDIYTTWYARYKYTIVYTFNRDQTLRIKTIHKDGLVTDELHKMELTPDSLIVHEKTRYDKDTIIRTGYILTNTTLQVIFNDKTRFNFTLQ